MRKIVILLLCLFSFGFTFDGLDDGSGLPASRITVNSENFGNNLSPLDDTAQKAFETINLLETYNNADAQTATGWIKSGSNVYLHTITDNVGIGTSTPNSQLEIGGSFSSMVDIVSSDLTLDATHHRIIVTDTATITLPTAVGIAGREYNIISGLVGIGTVTIATTSGQTIRGDASLEMYDRGSVVVISDGSNWERGS